MREVLWPKFGGEGEGDTDGDGRGVIEGENGVSSREPLNCDFLGIEVTVDDDDDEASPPPPRDSKVEILDCRVAEGIAGLVN